MGKFTTSELEYIKDKYPDEKSIDIAIKLGRPLYSIHAIAIRLGLTKSEAFKNSEKTGRFTKGSVPKNKGKKQEEFMTSEGLEIIKKTQFKKGHKPASYKPLGFERISKKNGKVVDVQVKVAEPNIWKSKRILLYEEHYGKVPKGALVVLIDGNPLNLVLENLMLIEKTYHGVRNKTGLKAYPKEIQEASLAVVKLRRIIKIIENGTKT